jgi:hypothetical protein
MQYPNSESPSEGRLVGAPRLELGIYCSQSKRLLVSSFAYAILNRVSPLASPSVHMSGAGGGLGHGFGCGEPEKGSGATLVSDYRIS